MAEGIGPTVDVPKMIWLIPSLLIIAILVYSFTYIRLSMDWVE